MAFGFGKSDGAAQRAGGEGVKKATTATFAKDVLEASRQVPVLVAIVASYARRLRLEPSLRYGSFFGRPACPWPPLCWRQ